MNIGFQKLITLNVVLFYFAKTTCFSAWLKASRLRRISRDTPAFKLAIASFLILANSAGVMKGMSSDDSEKKRKHSRSLAHRLSKSHRPSKKHRFKDPIRAKEPPSPVVLVLAENPFIEEIKMYHECHLFGTEGCRYWFINHEKEKEHLEEYHERVVLMAADKMILAVLNKNISLSDDEQ